MDGKDRPSGLFQVPRPERPDISDVLHQLDARLHGFAGEIRSLSVEIRRLKENFGEMATDIALTKREVNRNLALSIEIKQVLADALKSSMVKKLLPLLIAAIITALMAAISYAIAYFRGH